MVKLSDKLRGNFWLNTTDMWRKYFSFGKTEKFYAFIKEQLPNIAYIAAGFFLITVFKLPFLFKDSLDPDESSHLANAIAVSGNWKFWVTNDGTTGGPVNHIVILLFSALVNIFANVPLDYFTLHLLNLIIKLAAFALFVAIFRQRFDWRWTKICAAPYVMLTALSYTADMNQYNNESLWTLFAALAVFLLYKFQKAKFAQSAYIYLCGVFLGILPYVKLQTLPMLVPLAGFGIYLIVTKIRQSDKPTYGKYVFGVISFGVSCALPTVALVLYLLSYENGLSNAYFYYIANAVDHISAHHEIRDYIDFALKYAKSCWWWNDIYYLTLVSAAFSVLSVAFFKVKITVNWRFAFAFLMFTALAICVPFSLFNNYTLFLTVPVFVLLGETVRILKDCEAFAKVAAAIRRSTFVVIAVVLFLPIMRSVVVPYLYFRHMYYIPNINNPALVSLAKHIASITDEDDKIVVWGWEQQVYIYSQRASGTAQTDIQRLFPPYSEENIDRYISNILANKPQIIADVVAPYSFVYRDNEVFGLERHRVWTAIRDFYELSEVVPVGDGEYKIYKLKRVNK